jgi:hypothetical protein
VEAASKLDFVVKPDVSTVASSESKQPKAPLKTYAITMTRLFQKPQTPTSCLGPSTFSSNSTVFKNTSQNTSLLDAVFNDVSNPKSVNSKASFNKTRTVNCMVSVNLKKATEATDVTQANHLNKVYTKNQMASTSVLESFKVTTVLARSSDVGNLNVMVSLPRCLKDQFTLADASMME